MRNERKWPETEKSNQLFTYLICVKYYLIELFSKFGVEVDEVMVYVTGFAKCKGKFEKFKRRKIN